MKPKHIVNLLAAIVIAFTLKGAYTLKSIDDAILVKTEQQVSTISNPPILRDRDVAFIQERIYDFKNFLLLSTVLSIAIIIPINFQRTEDI